MQQTTTISGWLGLLCRIIIINCTRKWANQSCIFTGFSILLLGLLSACADVNQTTKPYIVVLQVAEVERAYRFSEPRTVADLLSEADVALREDDFLSHPLEAPLADGMHVTLQRSGHWLECQQQAIPFSEVRIANELLTPGEIQLSRAGIEGIENVCTSYQNEGGTTQVTGIEREVLLPPTQEVYFVGVAPPQTRVTIDGTIAYLSHGTIWIMSQSSENRFPLALPGDADGVVFQLSPTGESLLFTRQREVQETNELWWLASTADSAAPALPLSVTHVRGAVWHPSEARVMFTYTLEEQPTLRRQRLDPGTGTLQAIETSQTHWAANPMIQLQLSHDGQTIAYSNHQELGMLDLASGDRQTLASFSPPHPGDPSAWLPHFSWSAEPKMLIATLPNPTESQANRFDLSVFLLEGALRATLFEDVGSEAIAKYSPRSHAMIGFTTHTEEGHALFIADRDGSNQRGVFPRSAGTATQQIADFAWSADGQQILAIVDGNLWLIEVDSGQAWQLSADGGVTALDWAP